jgi:hypothetical protein
VAYFVDPVLLYEEFAGRIEPRPFHLPFASPAAESTEHARMKSAVALLAVRLAEITAFGKKYLSDVRHL